MPESSDAPLVAVGVDGAPAGWVAACLYGDSTLRERAAVWRTGLELFAHVDALAAFRDSASDGAAVAIDVPIGLLDEVELRPCDRAARRLLRGRASAVFTPPARYMLPAAGDYPAMRALAAERRQSDPAAKSLSAQAAGIAPKVAEVDGFVRSHPAAQAWLWECHPELSFLKLNGGEPVDRNKRSAAGLVTRLRLVRELFDDAEAQLAAAPWAGTAVSLSDMLDAYAALSTALASARGEEAQLGDGARDAAGLPMRIAL